MRKNINGFPGYRYENGIIFDTNGIAKHFFNNRTKTVFYVMKDKKDKWRNIDIDTIQNIVGDYSQLEDNAKEIKGFKRYYYLNGEIYKRNGQKVKVYKTNRNGDVYRIYDNTNRRVEITEKKIREKVNDPKPLQKIPEDGKSIPGFNQYYLKGEHVYDRKTGERVKTYTLPNTGNQTYNIFNDETKKRNLITLRKIKLRVHGRYFTKGCKEIPSFENYCYKNGSVYNKFGEKISLLINRDKYMYYQMSRDDGVYANLSDNKLKKLIGLEMKLPSSAKEIPGFKDYYIDEEGVVYSFTKSSPAGKILRQSIDTSGYLTVNLRGVQKRVHALMAETFIMKDYTKKGLCVLHADNNKLNPKLTNLSVDTQAKNVRDAIRDGLRGKKKKK